MSATRSPINRASSAIRSRAIRGPRDTGSPMTRSRRATRWRRQSRAAGHAIAHGAHQVGAKVRTAGVTRRRTSSRNRPRERRPRSDREMTSSDSETDVIVVGGGPAGADRRRPAGARPGIASCCSRRPAIRAFTSASRCCRPACRCCSGSASPRRSRPSASPSTAPSSSPRCIAAWQRFDFADSWDKKLCYAYEVRRSSFDAILLQRARLPRSAGRGRVPRARDRVPGRRGCRGAVAAGGRLTAVLARPLSHRCLRPRHDARHAPRHQAPQPPSQQLRHVCALQRCVAERRSVPRRRHHHLLVRVRLVLVHPACGRHHQCRCGGLAALHEDA